MMVFHEPEYCNVLTEYNETKGKESVCSIRVSQTRGKYRNYSLGSHKFVLRDKLN